MHALIIISSPLPAKLYLPANSWSQRRPLLERVVNALLNAILQVASPLSVHKGPWESHAEPQIEVDQFIIQF